MRKSRRLHLPGDWTPAYRAYHASIGQLYEVATVALNHSVELDSFSGELDSFLPSLGESHGGPNPGTPQHLTPSSTTDLLYRWAVVMVVAATEAYLQDALVYAAVFDSTIMSDSTQSASYAEINSASSLPELAFLLRNRWARGFLDRGGPPMWIARLGRMGAGPYGPKLGDELDVIWGIRHLVVHNVGVITGDFVRRHPEYPSEEGHVLRIDYDDVHRFADLTNEFVRITDQHIAGRTRSRQRRD